MSCSSGAIPNTEPFIGALVSDSNQNRIGICPACDRFIGPLDTCPYCDSPARRSLSIRVLRYASLVLALGGMAILYMVAVTGKVPAVGIGAITPAMNSAVIRVTGTVAAVPVTNSASGGYVSFQLAGGGGRLTVVAYEPCAGLLLERGLVPRKGDVVEATGTLNIRAPGTRRLILELPSQLRPAGGGQGPAAGDGRPPGNEPRTARPAGSQ